MPHSGGMKKPKRGERILATETRGAAEPQSNHDRNLVPAWMIDRHSLMIRGHAELRMQRIPAAQVNHNQHGVWV
jgi:hypothetical protein